MKIALFRNEHFAFSLIRVELNFKRNKGPKTLRSDYSHAAPFKMYKVGFRAFK